MRIISQISLYNFRNALDNSFLKNSPWLMKTHRFKSSYLVNISTRIYFFYWQSLPTKVVINFLNKNVFWCFVYTIGDKICGNYCECMETFLYWKCVFPFTAEEFLYQNQWGGISLLNAINLSERVLMSNTTFVSTFLMLAMSN